MGNSKSKENLMTKSGNNSIDSFLYTNTPNEIVLDENLNNSSNLDDSITINTDVIVDKVNGSPFDYFSLISKIREGEFGIVWRVQNKITKQFCAMKEIAKKKTPSKVEEMEILYEIEMMKHLDHPNMIKIFQYFSTSEAYFIIMEICEGGELYDEIIKHGPFSEDQSAFLLYQILSAVYYCHSNNIIHRDLKPENIIIERKEKNGYIRVKVTDFGNAKIYEKGRIERKIVGSSYYIAPEVLKKNYNEKCDLWSCGVILYLLLSNVPPFEGDTDLDVLTRVIVGTYDLNGKIWDNISDEAKDLIKRLLEVDVDKRISASDAINHAWFIKNSTKMKVNMIIINSKNEKIIENFISNLKCYKPNNFLQQTVFAYIVHNFPQLEIIETCTKFFNSIDLNSDGKITKNELLNCLKIKKKLSNGSLQTNNTDSAYENDVENIFQNLDTNKNGYIDLEEFVTAAINKEELLTDSFLLFAFRFFDKANSGYLTFDDIIEKFDNEEANRNNPNLKKLLKLILEETDLNKDGKISFDEFKIMMINILSYINECKSRVNQC